MKAQSAPQLPERPSDESHSKQAPVKGLSLWSELRRLAKLWPYAKDDSKLIVGAALAIPLVSVCQAALPLALSRVIDLGINNREIDEIWRGSGLFLVMTLGAFLSRFAQSILSSIAIFRMVRRLRDVMVTHILKLRCAYHDQTLSGTLVTRATSDFDNLNESLNMGVLTSVVDIAVLVGCISGLFLLDWRLALVALALMPIMSVVVNKFSKSLKKTMLDARVKIAALNAFTQESLYGSSTVKLLTAEKDVQDIFDKLNIDYRDAQMKSVILDASMFSVIEGFASVSIGLILYLSLQNFGFASFLTAGVLVAFVTYMQQLFEPLKMLGNKIAMLQGAFTSIDRIFGVLDHIDYMPGEHKDTTIKGSISFSQVSYTYRSKSKSGASNADKKVLKDVSFTVEPGHSLAIVGATGSGKSTIIKLLTRLYDEYQGQILIDGKDLNQFEESWLRRRIALVPQDIVLFDGDLFFNIGLGHPSITEQQIESAAKAVGADEFIRSLPNGYHTELREHGTGLSHGQRQLVAFARALAKNPDMIILDEATSSIDHKSEQAIQRAIETLLLNRTVIVIAHRLSTIRRCNQIMVLDHGKVIEKGTHDQLMAAQGYYYELAKAAHSFNVI